MRTLNPFNKMSFLTRFLCSLFVAFFAFTGVAVENGWPQWRGPTRDGLVAGASWPDKLDTNHLRQTWRVELAPSYSGPIVAGDRVFTTETRDKKSEVVYAFDKTTGRLLWTNEWEGALSVPFFAKSSGDWIRATPAFDGENLYVAGMRDVLVCLEAQSGKLKWRVDFTNQFNTPLPDFGFVSSPLVMGDAVYVQAGAGFVKLNKQDGKVIWRTLQDKGGMSGSAFSSPAFATLCGTNQILVQTREKLAGVDPADGSVLWSQKVEAMQGMNILTPVAFKDTLFTSTYGGRTTGFKVSLADGKFASAESWRHKSQGYMTTPVVVDGVAYTHLKSQHIMAIDVETGKELWTSDASYGKYMSLVAQGDHILALDERGILFLIHANKEKLEIMDQRVLTNEETWAHLAVVADQLFVRELRALTAYRWTRESQ